MSATVFNVQVPLWLLALLMFFIAAQQFCLWRMVAALRALFDIYLEFRRSEDRTE